MRSGTSESRTNPEWPGLSSGLPPDDVQSFAKDNGLETSLTSDELQMIKHGIDAGLGAARGDGLGEDWAELGWAAASKQSSSVENSEVFRYIKIITF